MFVQVNDFLLLDKLSIAGNKNRESKKIKLVENYLHLQENFLGWATRDQDRFRSVIPHKWSGWMRVSLWWIIKFITPRFPSKFILPADASTWYVSKFIWSFDSPGTIRGFLFAFQLKEWIIKLNSSMHNVLSNCCAR